MKYCFGGQRPLKFHNIRLIEKNEDISGLLKHCDYLIVLFVKGIV